MPKKSLVLISLLSLGCSTYQASTKKAQSAFYSGQYGEAAKELEKKAGEDGKDQLLYLFDRGMALQLAGDYKTSEKEWIMADHMSEVKDYVSLSTEAATLLANDNIKQYKGEDFEKVIINAFLAIDYLMQGNFEDALVECRRVNEKLYKYKSEAKRDYEQNPFARYLSAMIWESTGHLEDAYIDYKTAYELEPKFPYLQRDVLKLAKWLHRTEDLKKFQTEFGDLDTPTRKDEIRSGEVVLIYQQGKTAMKRPRTGNPRFPQFFRRPSWTLTARLEAENENLNETTHQIYSVSDVAIKTLDDAYAGLVAKRVAGVVAKAVVADQVAQHNQLLGALAWIGMNAADQADVRYWETLPDTIQIARLRLAPGEHLVRVVGLNYSGQPTGETAQFKVVIAPGKKTFINWRSLH